MLKIKKSKILYIILAITLLSAFVCAGYFYIKNNNNSKNSSDQQSEENNIDYSPGTKEEQQAADQKKEQNYEQDQAKKDQTFNPNVTPIISYASQYGQFVEVGAYVTIFEEGGTCTAKITKGTTSKETSVPATRNATTTDCPVMKFDSAALEKGAWSVTVSYKSNTYYGTSEPKTIDVK